MGDDGGQSERREEEEVNFSHRQRHEFDRAAQSLDSALHACVQRCSSIRRIDLASVSPSDSTLLLSQQKRCFMQQCEIVIEVPWDSRSVRPAGVWVLLPRQLHRTWVPPCSWEGKMNDGMRSDGGWRIVTTARTVCSALERSKLRCPSCSSSPKKLWIPCAASLERKMLHTIST